MQFWSWAPNTQALVDVWNRANPQVKVQLTHAGGGDDSAAKLLTASRAGTAPDTALVEYTTLPALVVGGVPREITDEVRDVQDVYSPTTWAQTTYDGHVMAVPQDVGPMALVYNQARFDELRISVPTTWEQFREAAAAVRSADPSSYIASFPAGEFGLYAGLARQAGGQWWTFENGVWTVGIADDPTLQVVQFLQDMAREDLILTDPVFTPEYNSRLNAGTILVTSPALWAPSVVSGAAPQTDGQWALAPLPQWQPGQDAVAYMGGSGMVVTQNSRHPREAAQFAMWMNASQQGTQLMLEEQNLYPAASGGQLLAEQDTKPPAAAGQQSDYYAVAAKIASNTIPVTWGPKVNTAKSVFGDLLNAAMLGNSSWIDAFTAIQSSVVADMRTTGFEVNER